MTDPPEAPGDGPVWHALWARVRECVDPGELRALAREAERLAAERGPAPGLTPARVALIGGATLDLLAAPLRLALRARGIDPRLHVGGYNQFVSEMLDPEGALSAFEPQVAVVVNTPFNVSHWPELHAGRDEVEGCAAAALDELVAPCRALHERTGCEIVLNTLHPLPEAPAGNLGARLPGDPNNFLRRLNLQLGDQAPPYVHLNDLGSLVARGGLEAWLDLRYWFLAKQPIALERIPEYANNTAAVVGALLGRSRKCVVVDLDNTLWGGIVGDDGIANLELGEGSPAGEAFKSFQLYLRGLKERGVLLAVCSKNEEEIARAAFREHPEMVLREDDFVAFRTNWEPKSDNLRAIAAELDLGLDALVFVDDNPAEREQVRQALPELAVPELGEDPATFAAMLSRGRYFEATALTAEDRERTETYRRRRRAELERSSATDLTGYLRSLKMQARIAAFDPPSLERITQLTNKTNQFNLMTRRVTAAEIETIASSDEFVTRSARLRDRFGDHGLIAVFYARVDGDRLRVENWLMSCRVLKRGLEHALFNEVLAEARSRGVREIVGVYRPTDRNALVRDLYPSLGFEAAGEDDGAQIWRLDVASAELLEHQIDVERGT